MICVLITYLSKERKCKREKKKKPPCTFTVCYLFRPPSLYALSLTLLALVLSQLNVWLPSKRPLFLSDRNKWEHSYAWQDFMSSGFPPSTSSPASLERNTHSATLNLFSPLPSETLASLNYLIQGLLEVSQATMEILTFATEVNYTQEQFYFFLLSVLLCIYCLN